MTNTTENFHVTTSTTHLRRAIGKAKVVKLTVRVEPTGFRYLDANDTNIFAFVNMTTTESVTVELDGDALRRQLRAFGDTLVEIEQGGGRVFITTCVDVPILNYEAPEPTDEEIYREPAPDYAQRSLEETGRAYND